MPVRWGLVVAIAACSSRVVAPVGPGTGPTEDPVGRPPVAVSVPFPAAPAFRLPHTFEPVRYTLRLEVGGVRLVGEVAIEGRLAEAASVLWLHGNELVVRSARARRGTGEVRALEATPPRSDELIGLRAAVPLEPGAWTLELAYTAAVEELQPQIQGPFGMLRDAWPHGAFRRIVDNQPYIYTLAEPTGARRIVPCIDEPDRKVPWKVTLDVPASHHALGNAPVEKESPLPGGRKRVELAVTRPLPSYLVAFAVGPFDIVDAGKTSSGVPVRLVAPHGRSVAWAVPVAPKLVERVERWFGTPYPYGKLDLVSVPHQVVAMEHPGLVTFDESLFGVGRSAADLPEVRATWISIAVHEIAHQWFGNLVTPAWWDDVWLSEGLTTWLAGKLAPEVGGEPASGAGTLADLRRHKPIRRSPTRATLESDLQDVDYQTSSAIATVLESFLGEPGFRDALLAYVAAFADRTATTADLVAALDRAPRPGGLAPGSLGPYVTSVLDAGTVPVVQWAVRCTGRTAALHTRLVAAAEAVPLCIAYDRDGARAEACTWLSGADEQRLELPARACPAWALPVRELIESRVDPSAVAAVARNGWKHLRDDERLRMWKLLDDDAVALPYTPALLASPDAAAVALAARRLLHLYATVPARLRPVVDTKVRTLLAARRAGLDLAAPRDVADPWIARLLAFAGDVALATRAAELAVRESDLPRGVRATVLAIAADASHATKLDLLSRLEVFGERSVEAAEALTFARDLADTVAANPALLQPADPGTRLRVLIPRCDLARRKTVEALIPTLFARAPSLVTLHFEHCAKQAPALDAAWKAWLTP